MKQTAMEKNRLEEVSSPRASESAAGTIEGANRRANLIWGNLRQIQDRDGLSGSSKSQGVKSLGQVTHTGPCQLQWQV